nr:UPF0280 family protein [uncultured Roseococcus sp.]
MSGGLGWEPPRRSLLPDGRLHLQDGPIDLVIGLEGTRRAIMEAREAAWRALHGVLPALSLEMTALRAPLLGRQPDLRHPVARRMAEAAWPHRAQFVTPMVAMSGACAEHVMQALATIEDLTLAHVSQGGDVALHLPASGTLRVGLEAGQGAAGAGRMAVIRGRDGVRGLATAGWRSGGFSLGIADAVTVLAERAPEAAAAASMIANAVDAEHGAVIRRPAESLDPATDLGELPVTVAVGELPPEVVEAALASGLACAERLLARGLILGACLGLQGRVELAGLDGFLAGQDQVVPSA